MKNLPQYFICILLILFTQNVVSQLTADQKSKLDSLNLVINNPASHDTSLASSYVGLSEILYVSNIDTLIFLCEKAESISRKALAITKNKIEITSLKRTLGEALNNLGYVYSARGENEKCLKYYNQSIEIQRQIGNQKGAASTLNNIGAVYLSLGEMDKCIKSFNESLKIKEELGDIEGISTSLNNIAGVYDSQGQVEKSLEYYHKALKMQEETGQKFGMSTTLNNIGFIYQSQEQLEKSLEYYNNAIKISEEIGNKSGLAASINNVANVFLSQGKMDKSLEFYVRSMTILEELGNKSGIATNLNNIGIVYYEKGQKEKSLEYYQKALKIQEEIGDKLGITSNLKNIASVYYSLGQYKKAKLHANKAFTLANELGYPNNIKSTSKLLSEIANEEGNYKEAFDMFRVYIEMRDSINNKETYKSAIEQNAKYEYEKQFVADSIVNAEAEKVLLANLEAEKAVGEQQKTEIAAQKKQNIYLFLGLGLVAFFGFFMYNRFKVTQKQKGIIEDQKQEVESQKSKVEKTLKELEATHIKLGFTHEQLEESHKEITDSINYAERIQRSFLASKESLDKHLKDYFVFFKPKEAVSGDFYWSAELSNNNFAFTVADSTGHGVPGAIMSLLNITSLEKAVETSTEPHIILNKTREIIVNRLKKDGSEHGGKDGMDCNLMVLNQDKSVLSFASANNTIVIIRKGEILEFKGDKMPVGKHDKDTESFTLHSVQLQKGDVIYALTDGFPDQFGGPKGKKYMIKNLKNKFLQIADMPMSEQEIALEKEFAEWKEDNEQIDDVCIIGVRV